MASRRRSAEGRSPSPEPSGTVPVRSVVPSGEDEVIFRLEGTFSGGKDDDSVAEVTSFGTFNGGPGDDDAAEVGGTFNGGPGDDTASNIEGTFAGGGGFDSASCIDPAAQLYSVEHQTGC